MQATEEPEHEKYDQYHAQSSTESTAAIAVVPVIATTTAKQQQDYDDDQNCAHIMLSLLRSRSRSISLCRLLVTLRAQPIATR